MPTPTPSQPNIPDQLRAIADQLGDQTNPHALADAIGKIARLTAFAFEVKPAATPAKKAR